MYKILIYILLILNNVRKIILHYDSTYLFVTLFVSLLTFIITTGQVALGQEESSPLKGMNFSESPDVYSDEQGILEASLIIEEKQGLVANQSVTALV